MVLTDSQKIGFGLICLGIGFVCLGMILLFDSSLIAIGNTLFLVGLYFSIGFQRTISLFTKPDRIRGTICFFLGALLVMLRWGLIGIIIEIFGFFNLFGNFLPTVVAFTRQMPGATYVLDNPIIAPIVDFLAGKNSARYSV